MAVASRFTDPITFTSASVATNGSVMVTIAAGPRYWDLLMAKLIPSLPGGRTKVALYKSASGGGTVANLIWSAEFSGMLMVDPMEDLGAGAGPTARNGAIIASGFDADAAVSDDGNLYLKITNVGGPSRTYGVTLAIEERGRYDLDGVFYIGDGVMADGVDPVTVANFKGNILEADNGGIYVSLLDQEDGYISAGARFVDGDWTGRAPAASSSYPSALHFSQGDFEFLTTYDPVDHDDTFSPVASFYGTFDGTFHALGRETSYASFHGFRANGTVASPSAVTTDDKLATFSGSGYNGDPSSEFISEGWAGMRVFAGQTHDEGTAHYGTYLSFFNTSLNSNSRSERLRILATGDLAFGSTKKFFFDGVAGTGDTYAYESAANVLDLYVGGVNTLKLNANWQLLDTGAGNPSFKNGTGGTSLHVFGSATDYLELRHTGSAAQLFATQNHPLQLGNGDNVWWEIDTTAALQPVAAQSGMSSLGGPSNLILKGWFSGSVSTPALVTESGAMTITPAAGSNLNVALSTTGDFTVNTNQLYVDTSSGNIGFGVSNPAVKFDMFGRFKVDADGVVTWGDAGAVYGYMSWDTGKAIVGAQSGKYLQLGGDSVRVESGKLTYLNLPTSAGASGSLWNDSGTVKVA